MNGHHWARLLTYVSGLVNEELLLQLEYLAAENRILRAQLPNRLRLTNDQRSTLAEIGKRLGRKGLEKVATAAKPETILGWFRKLVAQKFDGSKYRSYPGRPATSSEVVNLIVRLARDNSSWGYDRIAGALSNLGHKVSDQTVGNILRRHGIAPAPNRSPDNELEGIHQNAYGGSVRDGLLYRRGVDLARSGHLLRFVRDSTGDETSHPCRHGPTPDRRMDATSCPESDGYRIRHAHSSEIHSA